MRWREGRRERRGPEGEDRVGEGGEKEKRGGRGVMNGVDGYVEGWIGRGGIVVMFG